MHWNILELPQTTSALKYLFTNISLAEVIILWPLEPSQALLKLHVLYDPLNVLWSVLRAHNFLAPSCTHWYNLAAVEALSQSSEGDAWHNPATSLCSSSKASEYYNHAAQPQKHPSQKSIWQFLIC